ncbi:hypothetical protein Lqui_2569 [Legionella quinlivanii]|uniref:NAD(+)--protein-arginine ADP-ribosyltransferase n=1 Tax=Legionella quinlivanii TaxID=45073 RepID=A0A0W0XNK4_9GAMM|nr:hypothetical protein [Legionella quinlivanii]KTD46079.1 hypothetical protein Lqui_2569 [Legionella quinlivanii]MCW8451231.1 hypothetical protein [Legionella quinlivanii]SEG29121.1 hypothetical protein SAMN02746093_02444 [Legionella quinlivanii DSM 21216]STY10576.1 Uncharacterised protein [Legionella quinlivanii]
MGDNAYYYGPLNKNNATRLLEEATALLLSGEQNYQIRREFDKNNQLLEVTIAANNSKIYPLKKLLSLANLEHITIDDATVQKFNDFLNENTPTCPPSILEYGNVEALTDDKLDEMKKNNHIGKDLLNLQNGELKALNQYTQDAMYRDINNLLSGSIERLDKCSDNFLKEIFLTSMISLSAINKPLEPLPPGEEAKTYKTIRGEKSAKFAKQADANREKSPDDAFLLTQQRILSTTKGTEVGCHYLNEDREIIITYPNAMGKDISGISYYQGEGEILIAGQDAEYTLTLREESPGKIVEEYTAIQMRVLKDSLRELKDSGEEQQEESNEINEDAPKP